MKITDAKVIVCSPGRNFVTLKITTEDGIHGLGDATLNGRELAVASYLSDHVVPILIGRDARRIEDIWQYLYKGAYWRRGPVTMCSIAAVDTALWDIKGKALNVPVYQLLGGRVRNRLPVYLHAANAAEATSLIAKTKVKALKIGIDYSPDAWTLKKGWDPDKLWGLHLNTVQLDDVVNFVASIREAAGPHYDLALECHARYDVETAIQLCRLLEPFRLIWVEEPIPSDDVDAMVRVRNATRVPIAAGENIYSRYGFRPFLEKEALSVIQPDVSKTGGLLETRKIAAMAEVYSIPIAPHGVASPLGTMAAAHVAAATPNLMLLEFTHYVDQSYTSLTEPVSLDGEGFLEVRTTPGIGVALNEGVVKERTDPEFHPL